VVSHLSRHAPGIPIIIAPEGDPQTSGIIPSTLKSATHSLRRPDA
jgi:hypothetical protein